ncbi:receptor-like protein 20 [Punica granatum]|uniref:Uncharacterized protein n=2 Tax=Punica granatum TaxID=22663 RepID=A0A218WWY6_PUNGR|nr:receptor-like protein 20 [Punica granatum]OWM76542.1 hypothetical protein CDL15_Pgr005506 [Punica granatum]PKI50981.1 hypothetical protein CRG98_028608 [Punica granatum]
MGKGLYLFMSLQFILPFKILLAAQSPLPPPQLWCHDDERSALLEFKGSLVLRYPDFDTCFNSWRPEGEARNCCSWEGVECGGPHNHVIGLNLIQCGGDPYSSINSNSSIFRLVHLQKLNLNSFDLNYSSIPTSLGNLQSLRELTLSRCNLQGMIPPSISNLTKLVTLDLTFNSLRGPILPFISNLTHLVTLELAYNQFTGEILPSLGNLIRLTGLDLRLNQFTGEIPTQIASLTHLQRLGLSFNKLHGTIPASLSELQSLTYLFLRSNNLSGTVQLDMFSEMEHLEQLILSFNNFSLAIGPNGSDSLKNVQILGLAQCNLSEFPEFLEKLDNLFQLDLSYNNLSGQIPEWFLNTTLQTLAYLNLSRNSLTSFPRDLFYYNATYLQSLDLRFNKLQGSLPIPPKQIGYYLVSDNMLSGELSPLLCDWKYVSLLDLSKNNFTGELPQCLSSLSENLVMLTLHSNNFHGRIPLFGSNTSTCALEMIDLSNNQLQGPLPRSLSNCSELTFLNVGSNRIHDTFPSWLGSLSGLRVLILQSNKFHGGIEKPKRDPGFPKLQIIDLSYNNFQLSLPSLYFQSWRHMGVSSPERNYYLSGYNGPFGIFQGFEYSSYDFSMTIINKGVEMEYEKIFGYFKVVDLSSNNFTGEIPDSIASLDGLHLLNLSNNMLIGSVSPSMAALMQLESLDLSQNELLGDIPLQLTQLTFLAFFNVSYNNLSGPIPRGKQFDSFQSNSYLGNEGLCGDPLSRKCGSPPQPPPPNSAENDEGSDATFEIEWKAVAAGYAGSFIVAAAVGHKIITKQPGWFAQTFGLRQHRRRT